MLEFWICFAIYVIACEVDYQYKNRNKKFRV